MTKKKSSIIAESNELIEMLLNFYSDRTGLPMVLYSEDGINVWSKRENYSPLCLKINPNLPTELCSECADDHNKRSKIQSEQTLQMCHAGLWNLTFPLKLRGKGIGVFLTGQRRLKDPEKDKQSKKQFEEFLKTKKGTESKMRNLFLNTITIEQNDFDTHLLKSLKDVQDSLFQWLLKHEEAEERKHKHIQKIAHELLVPIQSIIADAENLFSGLEDGELKGFAEDILQNMKKLGGMAKNITDSLGDHGEEEKYLFSRQNLQKCIMENVNLFQKEASKTGITILKPATVDGKPFPDIEMSEEHLSRAIMNLFHNAVKYSYKGDKRYIEVVGKEESEGTFKGFYCLSISNLGVGILPDELEKVFDLGYRGKLSIDRNRTGSGIGLSEVKRIIRNHRGGGKIQSDRAGKDEAGPYKTTVRVYLPYQQS